MTKSFLDKFMATIFISVVIMSSWIASVTFSKVYAASEDECAIWLCLPAGFGEGCSTAHKAYLKRIKKGKSPLPNWSSCAVEDGTHNNEKPYTYREEFVTWFNDGTVYSRKGKICPNSGQVIKTQSCPAGYSGVKQTLEAICTNTVSYKTIFTDGSTTESEAVEHSGTALDKVLKGNFHKRTILNTCKKPK